MFETSGKLDEAMLKETWWPMFGLRNKLSAGSSFFMALVSVGVGVYLQEPLFYALAGLVVVVTVLQYALWVRRQRKTQLGRMKEMYGVPEAAFTTGFLEEGIRQFNTHSGGTATLPYDSIKKLSETEHYLLLFTKSEQAAVVFKGPELDKEGLIAFLKTKPTAIKWKE